VWGVGCGQVGDSGVVTLTDSDGPALNYGCRYLQYCVVFLLVEFESWDGLRIIFSLF
jgi:hypothetical protein